MAESKRLYKQISDDDFSDYFVAGNLLCTRWKNAGEGNEENREWWEIESIEKRRDEVEGPAPERRRHHLHRYLRNDESKLVNKSRPAAMTGPFFNYTNSFKNTSQDVIR